MLRGVITALVTPMLEDGGLDLDSLDRLIDIQLANGVAGLVINGSTAESALLDTDEKELLINHVISKVAARTKIIVGVNNIATRDAIKTVERLGKNPGIDYFLILVPMYVKPTQEGIYQHFQAIANKSSKPIIIYNVPSRTASSISYETVTRLANNCENIIGLKDATGGLLDSGYKKFVSNKPDKFMLYSGDDASAIEFILNHGDGVISVISNLIPGEFRDIVNYALSGKSELARSEMHKLTKLITNMFIESNPVPIKWSLASVGIIKTPMVRLPLVPLSESAMNVLSPTLIEFIK